jgi:hypothetical protein
VGGWGGVPTEGDDGGAGPLVQAGHPQDGPVPPDAHHEVGRLEPGLAVSRRARELAGGGGGGGGRGSCTAGGGGGGGGGAEGGARSSLAGGRGGVGGEGCWENAGVSLQAQKARNQILLKMDLGLKTQECSVAISRRQ